MKTTDQLLVDCGRELAVGWLRSAVTEAGSSVQMASQLKVVGSAANHVLATLAYNAIRMGKSFDDVVAGTVSDFRKELELVISTPAIEFEVAKTKEAQNK